MSLTGNKGEWSEIYTFLKLLADGRLNAADAQLNAIPNIYYPIIKILRQEGHACREYRVNANIHVFDGSNDTELLSLPIADFVSRSIQLFELLREAEGRSFAFEEIEHFLKEIDVNTLTVSKSDKSDIKVVVHDLNTGMQPTLGFSIKSMIGGNSTLFNSGSTTNFIYEISGGDFQKLNIKAINAIEDKPKIANRIEALRALNFHLKFSDIQSKNLKLNLQLIDGDLPKILGELLILKYSNNGTSRLSFLLQQLTKGNPLNFDLTLGHPFYEYKLKNFLTDSALGMTPAALWTGLYDATGGIIIVKQNGDLVCYHIYNRNEFQDYLLNNTRLEQASTSRYGFGDIYNQNGKVYIKLNLQIRFN